MNFKVYNTFLFQFKIIIDIIYKLNNEESLNKKVFDLHHSACESAEEIQKKYNYFLELYICKKESIKESNTVYFRQISQLLDQIIWKLNQIRSYIKEIVSIRI